MQKCTARAVRSTLSTEEVLFGTAMHTRLFMLAICASKATMAFVRTTLCGAVIEQPLWRRNRTMLCGSVIEFDLRGSVIERCSAVP